MEPLTSVDAIRLTLRKAVENGRFTLEQLDNPSPGFQKNARPDRRTFPNGYEGVQHRNLLRDPAGPRSRTEAPLRSRPLIYPDPIRIRNLTPLSDGQRQLTALTTIRRQLRSRESAMSSGPDDPKQAIRHGTRVVSALQGDVHAQ